MPEIHDPCRRTMVRNRQGQGQPVLCQEAAVPPGFSSCHCSEEHGEYPLIIVPSNLAQGRVKEGEGELKTERQEEGSGGRERRGTGSGEVKEAETCGCFTDSATCEEARKDEEKGEENNSRYTGKSGT